MEPAMFRFVIAFVTIVFCGCVVADCDDAIEITTALGKIRGAKLNSRLGAQFYAFRGIRYAEAPIGDLRFRNPTPVHAWSPKVFDATADGPMCPQPTENLTDASEDCLRLNVYTKDVHSAKPVIVYIHPGGFYSVSGQSNFAGPQNLMDRDVVLVTINYRLGTLGFLATNTVDAPGNAGLKDQVLAMRWVQEHIGKFGGDPKSVTLLGYSAGSFSIGLHMLSPMAKGLFHRGIAMSASPLGQFDYEESDFRLAQRQGSLLNCPKSPNVSGLIKCLKEKTMQDFVRTQPQMFDFGWNPVLNWLPVIESDFGQERYLIEHPYKTVQRADFYKVPLITGITEYEFISAAYYTLINETILQGFNEHFEHYAPIAFLYERDTPKSLAVSNELRSKYLKNETLRLPTSLVAAGELFSDGLIGFEYHRFLTLMARHTPIYTYLFNYKGRYSHFMYPPDSNQTFGAVHHDELLYLFHVPIMTPLFTKTDPENELIERITRLWTEFATKNNPNNPNDVYLREINWKLYTPEKKEYLEIGKDLTAKTGGFYQTRYQLWDKLFPVPEF